ncbi:MAG: diguanylate cyclase [Anaerolineales bacterium]|nr:diguanylate cyclase [Anaerolineales bacterium]
MSSLKQALFWLSFYLAAIFVLAQFDYSDSPIIDFAKYFYFTVMVCVPFTVFFPKITKVNVMVPVVFWGAIYFILLQTLDRVASAPNTSFAIVLLEFVLLEIGVWIAYQLADGISHAESILDAMALGAFPNRVQNIEEVTKQIKLEITRSRRYHRPLSLVILTLGSSKGIAFDKLLLNMQHDIMNRFSLARVGQVIDEHIRQTDIVIRDHRNRFLVLCPETNYESSLILAYRISNAVKASANVYLSYGAAAFPDDALNFDDLMDVAMGRLVPLMSKEEAHEVLESNNDPAV